MKLNQSQINYYLNNTEEKSEKFKNKPKIKKKNQNKEKSNIYDKRKYLDNNE